TVTPALPAGASRILKTFAKSFVSPHRLAGGWTSRSTGTASGGQGRVPACRPRCLTKRPSAAFGQRAGLPAGRGADPRRQGVQSGRIVTDRDPWGARRALAAGDRRAADRGRQGSCDRTPERAGAPAADRTGPAAEAPAPKRPRRRPRKGR